MLYQRKQKEEMEGKHNKLTDLIVGHSATNKIQIGNGKVKIIKFQRGKNNPV